MIHPTAIVHPSVEFGTGVVVGPHAIIEAGAQIGDHCTIQAHAVVTGQVRMGSGNLIGYGAIIGSEPQDLSFRPEILSRVEIGSGNTIREYATIHRGSAEGSATIVGDGCYLMVGAHLAHNVRVGSQAIIANNVLLGGYAEVGDRAFVGGGCVFHQYVRVGQLAICQGGSAFSKNIPPFVMAAKHNGLAGLNTVGLRRAGLTVAERAEIKAAFDLLYRSGLNVSQAVQAARERAWGDHGQQFWDFIAKSGKRGLAVPLLNRKRAPDDEA